MNGETDMRFFTVIAQRSSLSEAALELGLTASAVSRRLARMEDRLGVRLVNRTTRRVSLTSEGEAYLAASMDIINRIAAAEEAIVSARGEPQGLLRINATFQFGREHVAPAVSAFVHRHPGVEAQLVLTDAPLNIMEEGFHLQIRFGEPTATRQVMGLLLRNRRVLVASPEYLRRHGTPKRLSELTQHSCIVLRQEHAAYDVWRFGTEDSVRVAGGLSTNDGEIAVSWVLNGHGIMLRSEWDVASHVRAGRLVVVLPRYYMRADVMAVYPERLNLSAKVRLFVELLRERIKERTPDLQLN
ncbi:DNA-binding transcriptional LysR family regulator [Pseudorhizobium tarimense]|uniref:DNA-binding transcriptional LysR family regulator n=1 Tax=Pseudorhizobium tarimense TaxID=1079109 RepID=A0ABV2H3K2_9HYPH|nr:LysR family transcriptional regulator [Pseudorhizobium tarimense]MCJ8518496.1 LysR family transcriptional regulator [Pseudorhizobium tarimense]